jgi:type IV pilus assembly protein PilB
VELTGLIVGEGLVTPDVLEASRLEASRAHRPLVEVLVDRGRVDELALAELLARAVGTVVLDLAARDLDAEVAHLVPEEVARRHLAVPIAPDTLTASLRVVFADPLDAEARAALQEVTGLDVAVLVSTVSRVRATLDRQYGRPERTGSSALPSPRDDLEPETTRRTDAALGAERTATAARIAAAGAEATADQRHEALLLALIEAGVLTRADYLAALRRLRGRGASGG